VLEGYPTVVFCTAKINLNDQEKTRLLLLSPEVTQEKLRETIALKIEKESNREAFQKQLEEDPKRRFLASRVADIKMFQIKQVVIPEDLRAIIDEKFMESHTVLMPRNQRDISRLNAIIKGYALLNFYQRNVTEDKETPQKTITASTEDVAIGFRFYNTVSEANELGIPPEAYEVYKNLKEKIEDYENGVTRKDFQKIYFQIYRKILGRTQTEILIKTLETCGLFVEQPDPVDRRVLRYMLQQVGVTPEDAESTPPPPATYISDYPRYEEAS
jgi:hypothetical protein